MACEVASSPFSDTGIPVPFDVENDYNSPVGLSAISGFNSHYDAVDQGYIDPQNLSNAGSPSYNDNSPMTPNFTSNDHHTDFMSTPSSLYFVTDQQLATPFVPSALRNQYLHRRSVSEPPDGAIMHHLSQSNNPIVFSRDGHKLGEPNAHARPIKKIKQSRVQQHQRPQRQQQSMQSRYHLRRAYNQSMHIPPTSVPIDLATPNQHGPPLQQPQPSSFHPMQQQPQFVTSRVCTPAPEAIDPSLENSPAQVDIGGPQLANNPGFIEAFSQGQTRGGTLTPRIVMIKMGVDELRALITEVVQKAVEGTQSQKTVPGVEDDGDKIVVAGRSTGETVDVPEDLIIKIDE